MDGYLTLVAKFTDAFGYRKPHLPASVVYNSAAGIGTVPPDIQVIVDKVPLKASGTLHEPIIPPYFVGKSL